MLRRFIMVVCGLALASTSVAVAPRVVSADTGGCNVSGTAHFTPGLTTKPHAVRYTFAGNFTSCKGTYPKVTSGAVSASGSGKNLSCTGGQSSGSASVRWNTGQTSTFVFTTTGTANRVTVSGHFTRGLFLGDKVSSVLTFTVNPTQCATGGVTSAPFTGSGTISE